MSTTPTLYLEFEKSRARLDLTRDRYRIGSSFIPPTVASNVTLADGTSANVVGRSRVVGRSPIPTEFGFDVQVWGDSSAEVNRGLSDLQSFLAWAGDDRDPLYMVFKGNSDTPEPLYGQDGSIRYKVIKGEVTPGDDYSVRTSRESVVRDNKIDVLLQPYAEGRRQKLATAKGGVAVRRAHSDGSDIIGVSVAGSVTNYFHNPTFAHKTWSNKWTAGAGLVAFVNTDKRFVWTGSRSAYLVALAGSPRIWYQSITLAASTFTLAFRAKRADSGVIDSSYCQVYFNGAAQTSTYTAIGDGWYLVRYTGTGSASAGNYGISLAVGASVYVDAVQVEGNPYPTAIAHADALGCAPASSTTYHDSNTTRTAGFLKIPSARSHRLLGSGSISAIVVTPEASYSSNVIVFYESTTLFRLYHNGSTSWTFTDNTNSVTATDTLTAGKRSHLHVTWGKSGLSIYLNGVLKQTTATYTPASAIGDMYLLSDSTPSLHKDHFLSEYVVWGEELTSQQIADDYTSKLTLSGQATSLVPTIWSTAGNDTANNANDSTYKNFVVGLMVPGSAPALTRWTLTGTFSGDTYTVGNWELKEFIDPVRVLYYDLSGSAEAGTSGGEFKRTSVGTSETTTSTSSASWDGTSKDGDLLRFVKGRRFSLAVRARNATTGYLRWLHDLSGINKQQPQRISLSNSYWRNYILPAVIIPETDEEIFQLGNDIATKGQNTGTANLDLDYLMLMPHPSMQFYGATVVVEGREYDGYYGEGAEAVSGVVVGGEINLLPAVYNVLCVSAAGGYAGLDNGQISDSLAFTTVEIRPRWELVQ